MVSSAAAALAAGWTFRNGFDNWYLYGLLSFFATLSVYNFQRLYKLNTVKIKSDWFTWLKNHEGYLKIIVVIATIATLILLFLVLKHALIILLFFVFIGTICLGYVVHVFGKSLREIPYLKTPIIAFIWTALIILFPSINERSFNEIQPIEISTFFCYVFALAIPFDIRDLKYDSPELKTVPQILGIKNTKITACGILVLVFLVSTYNNHIDISIIYSIGILCPVVLVIGINEKRKDFYFALLDASMILIGLACFV